jgi:protein-L-isoaspartate(D-aspartate) O-methyltransferase
LVFPCTLIQGRKFIKLIFTGYTMRKMLLAMFMISMAGTLASGENYAEERRQMVEIQIAARGITDSATLEAMGSVPRHLFVPEDLRSEAYADYPLPIGHGQTISQPYVVALMTAQLELKGTERALEVGTGSGYQAAVLATIVREVYTIEIIPELATGAQTTLETCGYDNVRVRNADGYFGWEEHQPYDVIMITAAVDHIPSPLIEQLADEGRLILPLGDPLYYQTLTVVEKQGKQLITTHLTSVRFVPLTGHAEEIEEPESIPPSTPTSPENQDSFWMAHRIRVGIILLIIIALLGILWKIKSS